MKATINFGIIAFLTILCSCSDTSDRFLIKGKLSSDSNGELVIYPYQEVQSKKESDSLSFKTTITNGAFQIELDPVMAKRNMYITLGKERKSYTFFSGPGVLTITEENGKIVGKGIQENDDLKTIEEELHQADYEKLRYKRDLTEQDNSFLENYNNAMWEQAKIHNKSIPLTSLFYEKYWSADVKTIDKILSSFSTSIHSSYYLNKLIVRKANQLKVAVGKVPPSFSLPSIKEGNVTLEKYKGKYLVIDFWASWCGPCRNEIPNVKKIYSDYHDKGLEVLSISTDARESEWLKAVNEEQMPWAQVRDTKSVSNEYNVTYIPMIFLINPEGKIIAKGLHGEGLRSKIEEVLAER